MSTRRYTLRGYPKDANGKPLCRWCEKPVAPPRRTFCSQECVDEYLIRKGGNAMRHRVFERDRGVCAICGVDAAKLQQRAQLAQRKADGLAQKFPRHDVSHCDHPIRRRFSRWLVRNGWGQVYGRDWWDADHIVPVVRGGGECGLENLRTLCVPCHKRETSRLAAERARERRQKRQPELSL